MVVATLPVIFIASLAATAVAGALFNFNPNEKLL